MLSVTDTCTVVDETGRVTHVASKGSCEKARTVCGSITVRSAQPAIIVSVKPQTSFAIESGVTEPLDNMV